MFLFLERKSKIPVIFLVLVIAPLAAAYDFGSIKLKSGEEYKDVEFTVNDVYKTIQVDYEDQKLNVSFSDIEMITDRDGRDITGRIIGGYYKPTQENWLSERSKRVIASRAKPWNSILSFGGNFSFPAGSYYEGIKSGPGFDGDIRIAINNQFALQFILSRSGMRVGDDIHVISFNPDISVLDDNVGIHATRYEVALNVYQPFSRVRDPISMWYGLFGLGAVTHTFTVEATFRNNVTGEIIPLDESHTESKFTFVFGFGAVKMASERFGFDFSATGDLVSIPTGSSDPGEGVTYAYIFDLKISAVVVF
jgi:hypothetical protein